MPESNSCFTMPGYAAISERMAMSSDLASFRNFSALNYENIMYLQAELTHLENEWREKQKSIAQGSDDRKKTWYPHDWKELQQDGEHWSHFLAVRNKLREYNEAICQQHIMRQLEEPSPQSLKALNHILKDETKETYLLGVESTTWSEKRTADNLIAISPGERIDPISLSIRRLYIAVRYKLLGRWLRRPGDEDVIHVSDKRLLFPTQILSIVLSSLLPIAAIAILYTLDTMWKRIITLAVFTAAFSLILGLIATNPSRLELFAATATFSAVLVVFVGTSTI
ncbi:hypothetical protein BJ166DRAFT_521193 [Pestalotiopsis sp. NC0098]|nr:hypothetical protein BJ166DRAFT_521193 [Pestalotiopsis sp. NC0098]